MNDAMDGALHDALHDDASGHGAGLVAADVTTWRRGRAEQRPDWLVDEVPVALVFNGISYAVMLASPVALEDFARGFASSEGLVATPAEIHGIDVISPAADASGIEVHLEVAAAVEYRLKERRRNLSGRTGCGLCGTESLDQVLRPLARLHSTVTISPAAVSTALRRMAALQSLQRVSGAAHAAAWCSIDGDARIVREDVGRHNALDKVLGAMIASDADPRDGFVAITSRASVEMVQKTATMGIGILAAVSAPTALAVRLASECGLALAGFARGDDFVCYTEAVRFGVRVSAPEPRLRVAS